MSDVIDLTKRLVAIPSFVDSTSNEAEVGQFIYERLKSDARLSVTMQPVESGRFNVVATTLGPCRLLLAGHLDTVQPSGGWSRNPFDPVVEEGRLYGLGSLDMLGGIAAILSSVSGTTQLPDGLALLFYCDEEYDFAGMRRFIADHGDWRPELVVVGEPSDEAIWNSHRGIVELVVRVGGRSAHASRPQTGVNAIEEAVALAQRLRQSLAADLDPVLGTTTVNIAGLRGGLVGADGEIVVQANAVPDIAEVTLDIRTNSESVNAQSLADLLHAEARDAAPVVSVVVRHDLGALNTPLAEVEPLRRSLQRRQIEPTAVGGADKGYGDGQMLRAAWGVPVVNFGPSGSGMHGADEYVDVASLERVENVYAELLKDFSESVSPQSN